MSRFVSAGTQDAYAPNEEEWTKAEQQIQTSKKQKAEGGNAEDGRSLYEVLQANKAAKQEAFEENIKLKNQFRSLDEDEVEFLDSVLESTRNHEATVKKDTREQLDAFRKQQEAANKLATSEEVDDKLREDEEQWTVAKKRKRAREGGVVQGVKLRKSSSTGMQDRSRDRQEAESAEKIAKASIGDGAQPSDSTKPSQKGARDPPGAEKTISPANEKSVTPRGLGLVSYGSDSDS